LKSEGEEGIWKEGSSWSQSVFIKSSQI
jgi:hypothetical protein